MAQLYVYYSAMNAGKSTALLQSSYNYQERGMRTLVFTAEIDHRFGQGYRFDEPMIMKMEPIYKQSYEEKPLSRWHHRRKRKCFRG